MLKVIFKKMHCMLKPALNQKQLIAFLCPVLYFATFVFPFKTILCAFRSLVFCLYRSVDTLIWSKFLLSLACSEKRIMGGFYFSPQEENHLASFPTWMWQEVDIKTIVLTLNILSSTPSIAVQPPCPTKVSLRQSLAMQSRLALNLILLL